MRTGCGTGRRPAARIRSSGTSRSRPARRCTGPTCSWATTSSRQAWTTCTPSSAGGGPRVRSRATTSSTSGAACRSRSSPTTSRSSRSRTAITSALYMMDSWTIARRVTLNLGLRFAHDKGYVPEQCREAGSFAAGRVLQPHRFSDVELVRPAPARVVRPVRHRPHGPEGRVGALRPPPADRPGGARREPERADRHHVHVARPRQRPACGIPARRTSTRTGRTSSRAPGSRT